jgi:single-strand DNA-binding protein
MNKAIIIGKVGKDPIVKEAKNGKPYAFFSVATGTGEYTQWHNVQIFGEKLVERAKTIAKGNEVFVEGSLEYYKKDNGSNEAVIRCTELVRGWVPKETKGQESTSTPSNANGNDDLPF